MSMFQENWDMLIGQPLKVFLIYIKNKTGPKRNLCSFSTATSAFFRSSRPAMFCKKGVLRNLTKFTGKQLCQSLFFNKVATLLRKRLWRRCSHVNFVKFLKTSF